MTGKQALQQVALALVIRDGTCLVAQRHAGAHLGGAWEFPGGKCHENEPVETAALRELFEECGVRARPVQRLSVRHCDYGDRVIVLNPVLCEFDSGHAQPLQSQQCRWVNLAELKALSMPAINREIIAELSEFLSPGRE